MLIKVTNQDRLMDFITLPESIYHNDPNWVRPLIGASRREFNPKNNPAIKFHDIELYLVSQGTELTGRIAAFVDRRYNSIHREKAAFFGFFECQNNTMAAGELLSSAVRFARARGMSTLIGPVEFTINYQAGVLMEGYCRPTVMTPYNKKYYPELLESYGFTKLTDLYAYKLAFPAVPERLLRMSEIQEKRNPHVHILSFGQAGRLCNPALVTKLYNQAFCDMWGFVPMNTEEFTSLLHAVIQLNHWNLNYLACYDDTPVGLLLTMPDLYAPQPQGQGKNQIFDTLRVTVLGVLPTFRKRGIESSLGVMLLKDALKKGYKNIEFSFVLENNTAMNNYVSREFGVPVSRTFRIYKKEIIP